MSVIQFQQNICTPHIYRAVQYMQMISEKLSYIEIFYDMIVLVLCLYYKCDL